MEKAIQELVGVVVSDACDKTITIAVQTYKKHPLYKKQIKTTKKYKVHDEANTAKLGDKVRVVATRPLSKTKRYVLKEIVESAVIL